MNAPSIVASRGAMSFSAPKKKLKTLRRSPYMETSKAIRLALLSLLLTPLSLAGSTCPVTPITGTVDRDAIAVTFRNTGELPVRRLEFNCYFA